MTRVETSAQPGSARVPPYAWAWLQRSRAVLTEIAIRLTGSPPRPGFVDELRRLYPEDPLSRDVVLGAVADVAFRGRVPTARPAGASWDRGLVWWAAAATGRPPEDYDRPVPAAQQRPLFDADAHGHPTGAAAADPDLGSWSSGPGGRRARVTPSADRAELVWRLRALLRAAEGGTVPVSAVRQLLADLEDGRTPGP